MKKWLIFILKHRREREFYCDKLKVCKWHNIIIISKTALPNQTKAPTIKDHPFLYLQGFIPIILNFYANINNPLLVYKQEGGY